MTSRNWDILGLTLVVLFLVAVGIVNCGVNLPDERFALAVNIVIGLALATLGYVGWYVWTNIKETK